MRQIEQMHVGIRGRHVYLFKMQCPFYGRVIWVHAYKAEKVTVLARAAPC